MPSGTIVRGILTCAGLGIVIGCTEPIATEAVMVRIEPTGVVYTSGDAVTLLVGNLGRDTLYLDTCHPRLLRLDGTRWLDVTATDAVDQPNCADNLIVFDPGGFGQTFGALLRSSAALGTYKIRLDGLSVVVNGARVTVSENSRSSAAFLVTAP